MPDQKDPKSGPPQVDFLVVPSAEAQARASALLPDRGSEDARDLLGTLELPAPASADEDREYLPSTASEWVVHVALEQPKELEGRAVDACFDPPFRARFGDLTAYGRDAGTGRWTYLVSAEAPERVTALQLAWPYYATWEDEPELAPASRFAARLSAVRQQLASLGKVAVRAELAPLDAAQRAQELAAMHAELGGTTYLVVDSGSRASFTGREVWDVMRSLGLEWGDMDLFHWPNSSGVGDDAFFSVWTSTPPGYFLPEAIAAGQLAVRDLVFGFELARCADPVAVWMRMLAAARYAARRLGGKVTGGDGQAPDAEAAIRALQADVESLTRLGFPPGSEQALHFF